MKVIGVNSVQALVVPRVIAATFVALMVYSVVAVVGLTGSYFFVVYVQNVTPGAFVAGLTLLTGLPQVIGSLVKALLFRLSAGLIACYKGLHVGGGPTAVGTAVNETVVFAFMALFLINILAVPYDRATGEYIGPDGKPGRQANLGQPGGQTWQSMLVPPAP